MAQRRMISRSLGCSEKFAALIESENGIAEFCHSLFPLLVVNADDCGRLQGDAFTVKHSVFPISQRSVADFELALLAMHRAGLIARYMSGLRWYVQIINFQPHQPGLLKDIKTQLPPPDARAMAHIRGFSRFPANSREVQQTRETAGHVTRIPSKEGRKEVSNTPYSPPQGGRVRKLSKAQKAQVVKNQALGGKRACEHTPKCRTFTDCRDKTLAEARKAKS